MNALGFEKTATIVPVLGGMCVIAARNEEQKKIAFDQVENRVKIFIGSLEDMIWSIHGKCRWVKEHGITFSSPKEELEWLIAVAEIAMPQIFARFEDYKLKIKIIVFPPYDNQRIAPSPILLTL